MVLIKFIVHLLHFILLSDNNNDNHRKRLNFKKENVFHLMYANLLFDSLNDEKKIKENVQNTYTYMLKVLHI